MRKQTKTKRLGMIFDTKGAKGHNKDLRKRCGSLLALISSNHSPLPASSLSAKPPSMAWIGSGGEDDNIGFGDDLVGLLVKVLQNI